MQYKYNSKIQKTGEGKGTKNSSEFRAFKSDKVNVNG